MRPSSWWARKAASPRTRWGTRAPTALHPLDSRLASCAPRGHFTTGPRVRVDRALRGQAGEIELAPLQLPYPAAPTPRPLVDPEQTVPAPAHRGKPGARADHGRRGGHGRDGLPPPVEPQRRRARIQAAFSRAVLLAIPQHIGDRVVHLARRRERPGVVPVTPDGAAAAEGAVDRPRHADDKAPDA